MEYAPFGIDMSESRARFDEAAEMIVAALETAGSRAAAAISPAPHPAAARPAPVVPRQAVLRRGLTGLGSVVR